MKRVLQAIVSLTLFMALPVFAGGDAEAGKANAAVCAACHGMEGNSTVAQWPKLAGQHAAYLERQLRLIRDGAHQVPEMAPMVASMNDEDFANLAAYFSIQTPQPMAADEALVPAGERLYRAGNPESGVPACMACHGPAGEGNPLAVYPRLAGQHALYTANMLKKYRDGTTWGSEDTLSITMADVARNLSDAEIEAVASYIQGLHQAGE